jgi:hypothetical protein
MRNLISRGSAGIDLMAPFLIVVLAFVLVGSLQFVKNLPGGEHGLLLFERACPIHAR